MIRTCHDPCKGFNIFYTYFKNKLKINVGKPILQWDNTPSSKMLVYYDTYNYFSFNVSFINIQIHKNLP